MFFAMAAFAAAQPLTDEVTRQLEALPNHGVFDNLKYTVNGDKVILFGQVVNPDLKSSAEKAVKHIAGVASVDNQLQILPGDLVENDIRAGVFRALLLALQPGKSIHILVKNQNVTLVGSVRTQGDKNQAGILAHGVPLVANVSNDLVVGG